MVVISDSLIRLPFLARITFFVPSMKIAPFFCALVFSFQISPAFGQTAEPRPFSHPDRIRYDSQCLTIDGKDVMIFSGSFHYFRCPKALWKERFQKIKDAGFNCVETYVPWNWHERERPANPADFSKITGLQDVDDWLTMAEQYGLYVIVRPGPYICAEWDGGGFPAWLMLDQPAKPLRDKLWLRTDDPVFMAWSKHWLDAVCPIIARHQITQKAPGAKGVILFQIENEYHHFHGPKDAKVNYLTALVKWAQADGITVPLFTCLTDETRGVPSGPLRAVFDMVNLYPRWNVKKELDARIPALRQLQPDAPLATAELQGGWFANVGGVLSDQQPGITPAQIQNLTLYAWQLGQTLTNYYMLFGGTNFDDWGGRKMITSYDYNAPIREDGGVDDRYERVWALGHMLREHGSRLVRSQAAAIDWTATDQDVQVGERRAADGSRYVFVRTDNIKDPRHGHAHVHEKAGGSPDLDFDYQLEPFGSLVLYLPPGATRAEQGQWLPKPAPPIARPTDLPEAVVIRQVQTRADPLPQTWKPIELGVPIAAQGSIGSHFGYYKVPLDGTPGAPVTFGLEPGDRIVASAKGGLLPATADATGKQITVTPPASAKELVVLYENQGHINFGRSVGQADGILSMTGTAGTVTFSPGELDGGEKGRGEAFSSSPAEASSWQTATVGPTRAGSPVDAPLTWYRATFQLPAPPADAWIPWHLHMEANGDGFLYLNGHGLGRYWQVGPQRDYFLPACWLKFGAGQTNVVALDLCPLDKGVGVQALSIAPDATLAEKR
jgi:hypothetical protein